MQKCEGFIPLNAVLEKLNSFLSDGGNDWEEFVELFFTDIKDVYDFKQINELQINNDCIGDETFVNNIGWNYGRDNGISFAIEFEINGDIFGI